MDVRDRVVVVTGASSGIGLATARMAAERGAILVLAARRIDRLTALAQELPSALPVQVDLRMPDDVRRMVQTALDAYGRVDVLVNNAGQGLHVPIADVQLEDLVAVTELNVYAPLIAMQAVLPAMRRQGGGSIVNISSGTSRMVLPGAGAYAATKSALNMLSQVARAEWAKDGIAVSLIQPSITETEFHQVLRAGQVAGKSPFAPHTPELVAQAVLRAIETGEEEIVLRHTRATE